MSPPVRPPKDVAFAARLKELMLRDGLNQAAAAYKCQVTVTALQNYLGGRVPRPAQAKAISKAFKVPLGWLLEGDDTSCIPEKLDLVAIPGFSNALADALEVTGRTPETMARALGVQESDVESWIGGQGLPDFETLGKLFVVTAAAALARSAKPASSHRKGSKAA